MQSGSVPGPLRALLPSAGRMRWPPMIERINWKCVMVCGVFLFAIYSVAVQARDASGRYAGSPYAERFRGQHNEKGEWCCDKSDGHEYDGYYQFDKDGGVIVELDGKAHKLPSYMVLKGPNPTGHPVWWFIETAG